nr:type I-C CRISPR-associated protein Cas8c/Csd1 [Deinobacterium chartae]
MRLPPEMYDHQPVRYLLELSMDGTLEGVTPLGGNDRTDQRGVSFLLPHIARSNNVRAKLLADNGEYVLGLARETSRPDHVAERHRHFKDLVQTCAKVTREPAVEAVARFLESWNPGQDRARLPADLDPAYNVTFRVGGILPAADLPAVRDFWARHTGGEGGGPVMTCLITGQEGPVEARLPVKIKRIPEGQTAGTALVSANAEAFTAYGLDASLRSPISRIAGEKFGKALNYLLATRNHHIRVGSVIYVFWTREAVDTFWMNLEQPEAASVTNLLRSPMDPSKRGDLDENAFYAMGLSASGGRAIIRDTLESTVPTAKHNIARWFEDQRIVGPWGDEPRPFGLYTLTASVFRDPAKEMLAQHSSGMFHAALHGGAPPQHLLLRALQRARVDPNETLTHPRAALIKLILARTGVNMTHMHELNPAPPLEGREYAAYQCGRLLAVLENVQRAALGSVNASIVDRYYGRASSAPASVFGPLLDRAQDHLGKLRRTRGGTYHALDARLTDILATLPSFPKALTVPEQGLFALGYYHQRAAQRAASKLPAPQGDAQ